ncbi:hypothetical protein LSH36_634g00074 [Paralvinella palmiformis]|uniref:Caprin-1 dimerization domain-containing protein n=1 Tax=Paralvinella palmiformis TaxID=53620 RepID=A0AAD9J4N5_9ANNE|nr:hypothetical protein LSH36_634g00074 [Paralvinella palmiformis]
MPSACTKPENKASTEASNTIFQCITIVEKKVRNLEKRKGRLDGYKEKKGSGETLNPDQAEAITKYDGVIQNLEFARELQKQFQTISNELEKAMKKKAKRDKIERQEHEISRIRELLKLQELLSNMGAEDVREDFKKGSRGAVGLTDENLEQLDELYKLITPTREGETGYTEQLTNASEHIISFLDARDKSVIGTTYKQLREMVDKINDCGYFDNVNTTEEEKKVESEPAVVEQTTAAPEPEISSPAEPVKAVAEPEPACPPQEPVASVPEQVPTAPAPSTMPVTLAGSSSESSANYRDDSFFTTAQYAHQRRGLQEIVSSVQGNFNFLQDSEIDVDSPHRVDPAVVAARPMSASLRTSDAAIQQTSYQNTNLLGTEDQTASAAGNYSHQVAAQSSQEVISHHAAAQPIIQHVVSDSLDFGAASTPSVAESVQQSNTSSQIQFGAVDAMTLDPQSSSSLPAGSSQQQVVQLEAYEQTYSQNLMSQSLGGSTSSQHVSFGDQSASSLMSSHIGGLQDQSGSASSTSGPPQPIPLPSQSLTGQSLMNQAFGTTNTENTTSQPQEKKPYTMNPNADPFQSAAMFSQSDIGSMSGQTSSNIQQTASLMSQDEQRKPAWQTPVTQSQQTSQPDSNDYNNTGFSNSNQFGRNASGVRGGGRGNMRGGRGMNNGFPRGNSRGGAPYSGNRNGGFGNNRGGSRGGSAWQGYPSRSDYRPEGGYQGYNNSFNAGGGMRGGPPRGAMRGNRGGSGGFNRSQAYSQQV